MNKFYEAGVLWIKGGLIGIGNIIPGVSGATVALILGVYGRLITALQNFGWQTLKHIFIAIRDWFKKGSEDSAGEIADEMKRIDLAFLIHIGIGAVIAILIFAKLFLYLLSNHHSATYSLFFGLILASVIIPYRLIPRKSWKEWVAVVLAIAMIVVLSQSMTEQERLKAAEKKQVRKLTKEQTKIQPAPKNNKKTAKKIDKDPKKTAKKTDKDPKKNAKKTPVPLKKLLYYFFIGAIAISAMILPGLSGSFIMLLMGAYFDILMAVDTRQWPILICFAMGCGLGLLTFARILKVLFTKYTSVSLAFITGLIIGSLYTIWPFKNKIILGNTTFYGDNIIPAAFTSEVVTCCITFIIGFIMVIGFDSYDRKVHGQRELTDGFI